MKVNEVSENFITDLFKGGAASQGKKLGKDLGKSLLDDWIKVANQKGIKLPNPANDVIQDIKTRQPVKFGNQGTMTFKKRADQLLKQKNSLANATKMKSFRLPNQDNAQQISDADKKDMLANIDQQLENLKTQWFHQEVFNPNVEAQDLKLAGGYYFSKIRKYLIDNGVREGTIDKIAKGMYPDLPKIEPAKIFDQPKEFNKYLVSVFLKIAQKATDYHGNFYGSKNSADAIAKAKGSVDPTLINDLKDLSPQQKQAVASILAGGLGLSLKKADPSDPQQQEMPGI